MGGLRILTPPRVSFHPRTRGGGGNAEGSMATGEGKSQRPGTLAGDTGKKKNIPAGPVH